MRSKSDVELDPSGLRWRDREAGADELARRPARAARRGRELLLLRARGRPAGAGHPVTQGFGTLHAGAARHISASAPATPSSTSARARSTSCCRRVAPPGNARPRRQWPRRQPATRSRSRMSNRCSRSPSPTTSTSTRRSSTRRTSAACSGPTRSRCCPTGAICPSATTAAPGRSSSAARRSGGPQGQAKPPERTRPCFGPVAAARHRARAGLRRRRPEHARRAGAGVGLRASTSSASCSSTTGARATSRRWEYVPLGPFLGKSFATSISAWVTPLRCSRTAGSPRPPRSPIRCRYLRVDGDWAFDLPLEVELNGDRRLTWQRSRSLLDDAAAARARDLERREHPDGRPDGVGHDLRRRARQRGQPDRADLERHRADPLGGVTRTFLEDGDEVVLRGEPLGEVRGRIEPA